MELHRLPVLHQFGRLCRPGALLFVGGDDPVHLFDQPVHLVGILIDVGLEILDMIADLAAGLGRTTDHERRKRGCQQPWKTGCHTKHGLS